MLAAGSPAPPVALEGFPAAGGKTPVLLAFFKINCPTCQLLFPFLQRLQDRGGPKVVAVSQNDEEGTREFHEAFGISLETVLDREEAGFPASNAYELEYVPALFLVTPEGVIDWVCESFSRAKMEAFAARWGVTLFDPADRVPNFKPG